MKKWKEYGHAKVSTNSLRSADQWLVSKSDVKEIFGPSFRITFSDQTISYETFSEFLFGYSQDTSFSYERNFGHYSLEIRGTPTSMTVGVGSPTEEEINSLFEIIEKDMSFTLEPRERKLSKSKTYYKAKFSPDVINQGYKLFLSTNNKTSKDPYILKITNENETWEHDTLEEFLADYPKSDEYALFDHIMNNKFSLIGDHYSVTIRVKLPSRDSIESIFNHFENNIGKNILKIEREPIKIFIGHGRDPQWRDLKDHLHEKHGFYVEAYEIGARAGLTVKDVLESSFACLVMTGEDIALDGTVHARENVIHEAGLFQGRLGFRKAIVCKEEEVQEFSNIIGLAQVRFSKGGIKENYGDVLATIRREFLREVNGSRGTSI